MGPDLRVLLATLLVIILVLLAYGLRRLGIVEEADNTLFSRLVTNVTLPALLFGSLAHSQFEWSEGLMALMLALSAIVCLALGWVLGHALKLEGGQKAAVIMAAGFGSTSFLGIPIVAEVYNSDPGAVSEAVVLAGLGSQPIIFFLGPMIAMHYGSAQRSTGAFSTALRQFLSSPLFLAFVAGLVVANFNDGQPGPFMQFVLQVLHPIGAANLLLVTLAVGLVLELDKLSSLLKILIPVIIIKLVLMPVLTALPVRSLVASDWHLGALVLEAAMPSALIAVVFCSNYGCDAKLAARLTIGVLLASSVTLPLMFGALT